MKQECPISSENTNTKDRVSRSEAVTQVLCFEKAKKEKEQSERKAAQMAGAPRSTLRNRVQAKHSINASPKVVEFFESPEGVAFLHHLVLAIQLVVTLIAPGSIRNVCTLLVLAGLDEFVASSYGSQQKAILKLEKNLELFMIEEFQRLCGLMRPKKITIVEDETFHPQVCLVALEAASGFILLEMYAENRKSDTWTAELEKAIAPLDITIVQATSDEAQALLKHQQKELEARHSPDLFHIQQDLHKATSLPMAREVKKELKALEEAESFTQRLEISSEIYNNAEGPHENCSAEMVIRNLEEAKKAEETAKKDVEIARDKQKSMKEEIRMISEIYHPFDLQTGEVRTAEEVQVDLEETYMLIDCLAQEVDLPGRCLNLINKARKLIPLMVSTIAFFHDTVQSWVEELSLSKEIESFILNTWIPGRYLELAASRTKDPVKRAELQKAVRQLLPDSEIIGKALSSLCEEQRLLVMHVVEECAQLFQRSSSAVEGRNGHLSLFHHGHHRLTNSKLKALTVLHNFMKIRRDGTKAAERLSGHKCCDVFQWLLEHTEEPARPWKQRQQTRAA